MQKNHFYYWKNKQNIESAQLWTKEEPELGARKTKMIKNKFVQRSRSLTELGTYGCFKVLWNKKLYFAFSIMWILIEYAILIGLADKFDIFIVMLIWK